MIIDATTFNGEFDLLEIRLNILDEYVDQFVIVEAPTTFSGKPKPLYYKQQEERYAKWKDKIKYFVIDENYSDEERKQAENSPNTRGAEHWKHEFLQKESIKKALTHLNDGDVCFIGDCDEIWDDSLLPRQPGIVSKLKLKVFTYYINNRSDEEFYGTITGYYKDIKDECLNHLRVNANKTFGFCGWHFTSLKDGLKRKLTDSYTSDSYASPEVMANLEDNIENNRDFLGRPFTYTIDESELPKYIIDNKLRYAHLFKS